MLTDLCANEFQGGALVQGLRPPCWGMVGKDGWGTFHSIHVVGAFQCLFAEVAVRCSSLRCSLGACDLPEQANLEIKKSSEKTQHRCLRQSRRTSQTRRSDVGEI